jgi:acyl-CoA synthetase (AMP-forming)/AMP-acid ligase II
VTRNVAELLAEAASRRPDHVGVVDRDERVTWSELLSRSQTLASALRAIAVSRGNRIGILGEHGLPQIVGLFATALTDGVFTIVNPLLKQGQVLHQLADAKVRAVVGQRQFLNPLSEFLHTADVRAIEIDAYGRLVGPYPAGSTESPTQSIPADVACLIYTSGSTGKSKGVVVPHRTLLDGARIVGGYLGIGPSDTTLSLLPYSFDYGLNQLLTAVRSAARLVAHRYLLPADLLRTLATEDVTGFAAVPTLWPKLLDPRLVAPQAWPALPRLRYVTTAGGVHSQTLLSRLTSRLPGVAIYVMYGLTESFRSTYLPPDEVLKRPGSIGRPVPEVDILVVDSEGRPCPPGVAGELIHRGAFINYGYLNNPELTREKYIELPTGGPGCRPEIAVRSGDLVSRDREGFIYYHGRIDHQIKSMGYRVSPGEVEENALSCAGVAEAAAFGVPDDETGEAIVLAYTTALAGPIANDVLRRHLAESLPAYAVPKEFAYFERLPQTPTGKVDYGLLKRSYRHGYKSS